jgi:uncharacterized protein (TIGR03792 family)
MVIEFLTFDVDPAERETWLQIEERHWSRFLEQQDGFVSKQMWQSADDETKIHAVIWWESMEQWKAIPQEALDAVVEAMGPHEKEPSMKVYNLLRDG